MYTITDAKSPKSVNLMAFVHNGEAVLSMTKDGEWVQNPRYSRAEITAIIAKTIFGVNMTVKEED